MSGPGPAVAHDRVPLGPGGDDYTWPYPEYVDNLHMPPHHRLTFRIKLDPRALTDGVTPGGALGRWFFHCHIFFHHADGMISELVVTDPNGNERPYVDVDNAELSVQPGQTATVTGTYKDPDGDPVALSASQGKVSDTGAGKFTWTDPSPSPGGQLVYITATDSNGLKDQIPLYLQAGATTSGPQPGPAPSANAQPPNQAPVLKGLKVTPSAFTATKALTKLQATTSKKKRGAKISFDLSEPGSVRFTVKRTRPQTPKAKAIAFSRQVTKPGPTAVGFSARFKKAQSLAPGRYRLTAEATDSGGMTSEPLSTSFTILR